MNPASDLLAAPAREPPVLNTSPLPRYANDRQDYGMTIGIERTPNGRLWACWVKGGDNEKAYFVLATSDDRGATWSEPRLVIDPHDPRLSLARRVIVGNLWLDPRGRLWLFFDQAMTHFDGRAGTWFTRCDDPDALEPRWTPPVRIWHGCALNKPVVLSSGEWLLTVSLWDRGKIQSPFEGAFSELDSLRMANVLVSADEGQTWDRRGGVAFPDPQFDEAQVVQRKDGSLWLTARTRFGLWGSESRDFGATWSAPRRAKIANANSRHFLRRLESGRRVPISTAFIEARPLRHFPWPGKSAVPWPDGRRCRWRISARSGPHLPAIPWRDITHPTPTNPPRGPRGYSRSVRAYDYGLKNPDPTRLPFLFAQIESEKGIENVEAIAAVLCVGALFVGPADLKLSLEASSAALGYEEAINRVLSACRSQKIPSGILVRDPRETESLRDKGFTKIAVDSDMAILRKRFLSIANQMESRSVSKN